MPAKNAIKRSCVSANQVSQPSSRLNLDKDVNGATQRLSRLSHRFQWKNAVFLT